MVNRTKWDIGRQFRTRSQFTRQVTRTLTDEREKERRDTENIEQKVRSLILFSRSSDNYNFSFLHEWICLSGSLKL